MILASIMSYSARAPPGRPSHKQRLRGQIALPSRDLSPENLIVSICCLVKDMGMFKVPCHVGYNQVYKLSPTTCHIYIYIHTYICRHYPQMVGLWHCVYHICMVQCQEMPLSGELRAFGSGDPIISDPNIQLVFDIHVAYAYVLSIDGI